MKKTLGALVLTAALAVTSQTAFSDPGGKPSRTAKGFPMAEQHVDKAVARLPEVPGEAFTGIPGGKRVKPEKDKEERVVTITDGVTGKQYVVPYTAEIQAEQTPDGAVHGRVLMPAPEVLQAAIDRVIPANEQAEMRRPKAERKAAK